MKKNSSLYIVGDCKNLDGKNISNEISNYNEVHLFEMGTEDLFKVIEKGKNNIKTLVLHNCYLDLKHLIKLKKLSQLYIEHEQDLKKNYGYKDEKTKGVWKQWLKKNKWIEKPRNTKKFFAFCRITAHEAKYYIHKKDEDFLKEIDQNLRNFPKNFNHKKYPVIPIDLNNPASPFYFSGKDLVPLGRLKNLKFLSFYADENTNLSFIKKLSKLNELRLSFTNLEEKCFLDLEKILPQEKNHLHILGITGHYNYQLKNTNIQFLLKYKKLRVFRIDGYTGRLQIDSFRSLKTIETLNISEYLDVADIRELLTFKKLQFIQKLRIGKCDNLTILCEYLKDTGIRALVISNLSNTNTLLPIKNLNHLEILAIFKSDESITNISHLRFLRYLFSLRLDNIRLKDISSLKINKKFLQVLAFTRSTIDKIQGLIDYKQLFWLSLSMCDKKHDFSFLNKLNLDTLHLTNIENFNFTKSLPKLNKIKTLRLEGSKTNLSDAVSLDSKTRDSLTQEFLDHWKFYDLSEENKTKVLEYYGTQNIDFVNKFPNLIALMINNLSVKELKPLMNLKKLTDLTLWNIDNNIFDNIDKITNLKSLDLSFTRVLADSQLIKIKKLKHLECLALFYSGFWSDERRDKTIDILKNNKLVIKSEDVYDYDFDQKDAVYYI